NASDYRPYYFLAAAQDGQSMPLTGIKVLLAQSLKRNDRFAAAHALLGKVLLREGLTQQAVTSLETAIALRPMLVQAHMHLARAYRQLGNEAAATREFEIIRQLKEQEQKPMP